MIVVIDTNVIYQALRSKNGASHFILNLIREGKLNIALSINVFKEYEDVLLRPKTLTDLKLDNFDIDKILAFLAYIGKPFNVYYLFRPNLKDENDNMYIDLALASNSKYIITNNISDFTINNELKFENINILTPTKFIKLWRNIYEK
jgi:putative PIN family toxin of toxin-antitoxin system